MSATFFVTRYHVAALFTAGAVIGMLLTTCARPEPQTPADCERAIIEPFLHRKPGDVTLDELRELIRDLQRCSRKDTLFLDDSDLFGIGATGPESPSDAGIVRSLR